MEDLDMKSMHPESEDKLPFSALRLKYAPLSPQKAWLEVNVSITDYFYTVNFGPEVHPRSHRVGKNLVCTCYLAELCPAAEVVRAYLSAGGEPVPDPPPGFYPVIPSRCPICHAPVAFDRRLSSQARGAGWRCEAAGSAHYWQRMVQALAWKFACKYAHQQGLPPPERPPADFW
jgi:hypothetical protein